MMTVLVPAPCKVMPLMASTLVQLLVPAGNKTVSPGEALVTAALTSVSEQLAALITAAWVCRMPTRRIKAKNVTCHATEGGQARNF